MYSTFEKDKSVDQEEVKPTGASAEIGRQEQPEWRYVETTHSAVIVAGNIQLHPRWNGLANTDEVRAVVRKAAAAPALYEELKASALAVHTIGAYHNLVPFEQCQRKVCIKARAALALVDGPTNEGDDVNNEQVEDDQRCSECGSTEAGNCFYCKAD